jgi:Raf kinase inhibitor-like YbhB/YbcL family protein
VGLNRGISVHKKGTGRSGEQLTDLMIMTNAFRTGEEIPVLHTCDGANRSPALSWRGVPSGTKSLALIMDDPDDPTGTFTHWVICNMAPDRTTLPEGIAAQETLDDGGVQGMNNFRRPGYGGPCPPHGKPHRYYFRLYALSSKLIPAPRDRESLERAMKGHILATGLLMGIYRRR